MKTIKIAPNTRTQSKKYSAASKIRRSVLNGATNIAKLARTFGVPYSWAHRIVKSMA